MNIMLNSVYCSNNSNNNNMSGIHLSMANTAVAMAMDSSSSPSPSSSSSSSENKYYSLHFSSTPSLDHPSSLAIPAKSGNVPATCSSLLPPPFPTLEPISSSSSTFKRRSWQDSLQPIVHSNSITSASNYSTILDCYPDHLPPKQQHIQLDAPIPSNPACSCILSLDQSLYTSTLFDQSTHFYSPTRPHPANRDRPNTTPFLIAFTDDHEMTQAYSNNSNNNNSIELKHTNLELVASLTSIRADDTTLIKDSIINDEGLQQSTCKRKRLDVAAPCNQEQCQSATTSSKRSHLESHNLGATYITAEGRPRKSKSCRHPQGPALNTNMKPRARQGTANDPQILAARNRRERINSRLKILQELVPNGAKVDLVTMLEKAINYVKFLQLQVKVLTNENMFESNSNGQLPQGNIGREEDLIPSRENKRSSNYTSSSSNSSITSTCDEHALAAGKPKLVVEKEEKDYYYYQRGAPVRCLVQRQNSMA